MLSPVTWLYDDLAMQLLQQIMPGCHCQPLTAFLSLRYLISWIISLYKSDNYAWVTAWLAWHLTPSNPSCLSASHLTASHLTPPDCCTALLLCSYTAPLCQGTKSIMSVQGGQRQPADQTAWLLKLIIFLIWLLITNINYIYLFL